MERSRHVNSSDSDDVSWAALSGVDSVCDDVHSSWHVANGNLIRRLLNFDLLETDKFA